MMRFFLRVWASAILAVKRLLAQPGLSGAMLLGLIIAVALMMSIPMYADAVYYQIFQEAYAPTEEDPLARPPFSLLFVYSGGSSAETTWEEAQPVDFYISERVGASISLPEQFNVRHFRTDTFRMYPGATTSFTDPEASLGWVRYGMISDLEAHINVMQGRYPQLTGTAADSPVEILVYKDFADETGIQAGEEYIGYINYRTSDGDRVTIQMPLLVAGIWEALDETDPFWFIQPAFLSSQLLVTEDTYAMRISPYLRTDVDTGMWYVVMDDESVDYGNAATLADEITNVQQEAAGLLEGTRLTISPRSALLRYQRSADQLTVLLYAFAVPVVGLLLAFIGLTSSLSLEQRRNELAVLRSRGAMRFQLMGIALLEGLILSALALGVGTILALWITDVIGQTRSFLDFSLDQTLRVRVNTAAMQFGGAAVILTLITLVIQTFFASKDTIISYKQELTRKLRRPWWQRAGIDILLLIPAVYGMYVMQEQGNVALLDENAETVPLVNPLFFLVPSITILALTLLFLRLIPILLAVIGWITTRTPLVSLVMATRHLARTPGFYSTPLLLLVLTLSLSSFTASLAKTLDGYLYDEVAYAIGADAELYTFGEALDPVLVSTDDGAVESTGPTWNFLPISDYVNQPGVMQATRVGNYAARSSVGGRYAEGRYLGVDRYDFSSVAFWREDFAQASLGELMNGLALYPNGLLLPKAFMDEYALEVGDTMQLRIRTYGEEFELEMRAAGGFDLFPTWYVEDGPLFVGNLEYFFSVTGTPIPHAIWMRTDADFSRSTEGVIGGSWEIAQTQIDETQKEPQRQGLFGLLSVGFIASAVLAVIGLLLYMLFSFRRRMTEMGVLRAIGLSASRMILYLIWELGFLILLGGLIGVALGVLVSNGLIPFLQVGNDALSTTPPFVVIIAWADIIRIYILFGILFVIALILLTGLLLRMKIFQAIKLGESV